MIVLLFCFGYREWRAARIARERGMIPVAPPVIRNPSTTSTSASVSNSTTHIFQRTSSQASERITFVDKQHPKSTFDYFMQQVQQVYPVEEPTPANLRAELRSYQKQSLAFMLRNERLSDDSLLVGRARIGSRVRGGILADEVGMGKTMVCISLILSNPCPERYRGLWIDRASGITLKTTIIFTPPTLLAQWYDEFKKYAPSLNVVCAHGSQTEFVHWKRKLELGQIDLTKVDVLLVSQYLQPRNYSHSWNLKFWRVINDESHKREGYFPNTFYNLW